MGRARLVRVRQTAGARPLPVAAGAGRVGGAVADETLDAAGGHRLACPAAHRGPRKRPAERRSKLLTWYGGPYDPDDIDEPQIRITLKRMANASRRRRPNPSIPWHTSRAEIVRLRGVPINRDARGCRGLVRHIFQLIAGELIVKDENKPGPATRVPLANSTIADPDRKVLRYARFPSDRWQDNQTKANAAI
jgi:hypothetical protein